MEGLSVRNEEIVDRLARIEENLKNLAVSTKELNDSIKGTCALVDSNCLDISRLKESSDSQKWINRTLFTILAGGLISWIYGWFK